MGNKLTLTGWYPTCWHTSVNMGFLNFTAKFTPQTVMGEKIWKSSSSTFHVFFKILLEDLPLPLTLSLVPMWLLRKEITFTVFALLFVNGSSYLSRLISKNQLGHFVFKERVFLKKRNCKIIYQKCLYWCLQQIVSRKEFVTLKVSSRDIVTYYLGVRKRLFLLSLHLVAFSDSGFAFF